MSKILIESFFPFVTSLQNPVVEHIHGLLFPTDVAAICPEQVFIGIRRPFLALCAAAGFFVGVRQYARSPNNLLSLSNLFFAAMNITALLLHCFLPSYPHGKLIETYPVFWILDCFFTGTSSMSLIGGLFATYLPLKMRTTFESSWRIFTLILGSIPILVFTLWRHTLLLELWYLLPSALAGYAVLLSVFLHRSPNTIPIALLSSMVIFPIGMILDPFICRWQGGDHFPFFDLLTAPTILFFTCTLAFHTLNVWLRRGTETERTTTKSL